MDAPYYNGEDTREFGPVRDICEHCGADLVDDGHEPSCEWHPSFFDKPEPEYNSEDDCDAA